MELIKSEHQVDDRTGAGRHVHRREQVSPRAGKSQLSSFILFASLVVMINLCPFQSEHQTTMITSDNNLELNSMKNWQQHANDYRNDAVAIVSYIQSGVNFVKLMFSQPMRLNGRTTRFSLAEARVLGKMAKVWYIKKKIKKFGKKLKKHTIAVPVFTAIPIYEHSYYPQPHVTHISHGGHHAAAASSYVPTAVSPVTAASSVVPMTAASAATQQQMATSASNQHQMTAAYRLPPHRAYGGGAMYQPSAAAHQIINAYAPSPPLFVDDTGGLYGTYGNAYGRYDGGYHVW